MAIRVNQNRLVQCFFEEVNHANVLAHSSLEYDRRLNAFSFAHVVQVVGGNCFAQASDNVFARVANLQLVHQIALGEHRAASGNVGGLFRG